MKKRIKFIVTFEVDLDLIPGPYHEPNDWLNMVQNDFMLQAHYNARCYVHTEPYQIKPLPYDQQHSISSVRHYPSNEHFTRARMVQRQMKYDEWYK